MRRSEAEDICAAAKATRIVAFAYAGGGGSAFAKLRPEMPDREIVSLQLPGREEREDDPFVTDVEAALADFIGDGARFNEQPYVLLGHSLGGHLAFLLARRLCGQSELRRPAGLILSAVKATSLDPPKGRPSYAVPDEELMRRMEIYGGMPKNLSSVERSMLLPKLRADLRLLENCLSFAPTTIDLPMLVLGGRNDGAVTRRQLEFWTGMTTGPVRLEVLPGGHFFLFDTPARAAPIIEDFIRTTPKY